MNRLPLPPVTPAAPAWNNRRGKTALALKGIAYVFLIVMLPILYLVGLGHGQLGVHLPEPVVAEHDGVYPVND